MYIKSGDIIPYKDKNKQRKASLDYYYRNKNICKDRRHKWIEQNKEHISEYNRKYKEENKDIIYKNKKEWGKNNPDKRKIYDRRYNQTETGRLRSRLSNDKRKRNLKCIPLFDNPFPKEIPIDYHHINNLLVIPVPRITHRKTVGNSNHRKKCNEIMNKLLDINSIITES